MSQRYRLTVIHAATQDNMNGTPWPPDGNDLWSVVSRANGITKWRRIALMQNTRVALAANDARLHGGTTTKGTAK